MIGKEFTFNITPSVPGSKIYYTLNGRRPGDTDLKYEGPLTFIVPKNEKRELQTIVITPSGRRSVTTKTVMYNRDPLEPARTKPLNKGLKYHLSGITPGNQQDSGTVLAFDNTAFKNKAGGGYVATYEGLIEVNTPGLYHFSIGSNEGAEVFIGDELVIQYTQPLKYRWTIVPKTGSIPLQKGFHKIRIMYEDSGGNSPLQLTMWSKQMPQKIIEAKDLYN